MAFDEHREIRRPPAEDQPAGDMPRFRRRTLLVAGGGLALGIGGLAYLRRQAPGRAGVFIARGQRYGGDLATTIRDGLAATGFDAAWVRGRRVLLKPNLVEPTRIAPQMTTHPAVILAASEVFRGWGAEVLVGEGPGHLRDTELALFESQVREALDAARLPFADLNYEAFERRENAGRISPLAELYFPRSVLEADLIVSLPKLKTHHWIGFTAAMKNLYGVMPGLRYGWPKNVLHHAGIPESAFDINASLPRTVAVVDAIECMQGDGPIMGSPKSMGLILVGTNLTALDATCARIIGLDPLRTPLLRLAAGRLGPVAESRIEQRGERWRDVASPFEILDVPYLQQMRDVGEQTSRLDRESAAQLADFAPRWPLPVLDGARTADSSQGPRGDVWSPGRVLCALARAQRSAGG